MSRGTDLPLRIRRGYAHYDHSKPAVVVWAQGVVHTLSPEHAIDAADKLIDVAEEIQREQQHNSQKGNTNE